MLRVCIRVWTRIDGGNFWIYLDLKTLGGIRPCWNQSGTVTQLLQKLCSYFFLSLKRLKTRSTDSNRKTETIQVKRIKREFVWSLKHWNSYRTRKNDHRRSISLQMLNWMLPRKRTGSYANFSWFIWTIMNRLSYITKNRKYKSICQFLFSFRWKWRLVFNVLCIESEHCSLTISRWRFRWRFGSLYSLLLFITPNK